VFDGIPTPDREFKARPVGGVGDPVRWLYTVKQVGFFRRVWVVVACPANSLHDINRENFYKRDDFKVLRVYARSEAEAIHKGLSKIDPLYNQEQGEKEDVDPF